MIQDIYPSGMDISYKNRQPSEGSVIMLFRDGKLLSAYDGMDRRSCRDMNTVLCGSFVDIRPLRQKVFSRPLRHIIFRSGMIRTDTAGNAAAGRYMIQLSVP